MRFALIVYTSADFKPVVYLYRSVDCIDVLYIYGENWNWTYKRTGTGMIKLRFFIYNKNRNHKIKKVFSRCRNRIFQQNSNTLWYELWIPTDNNIEYIFEFSTTLSVRKNVQLFIIL